MMKAIKNFMNKPWTWGTYFKFCGVAMGLWTAIIGAYVAWAKWNEKKALDKMRERAIWKRTKSERSSPLIFFS